MCVNARGADTTSVRAENPLLRRVVGGAAAAVLVLDVGAAIVVGSRHDERPVLRPPASMTTARPLAVVTTRDGRRYLADPSTPKGRQAIDAALASGGTVVPVPAGGDQAATAGDSPSLTIPEALRNDGLAPLPASVTLPTLPGGSTVSSVVGTASSVVGTASSTVSSIVGTASSTVSSLVTTASSTVGSLVTTVSTTVAPVVTTVSSTVGSVVTAVSTTIAPVVTTVSSTLSSVVTTVSTVLPTTSSSICVLVLCH